jgi:hypothetical protein
MLVKMFLTDVPIALSSAMATTEIKPGRPPPLMGNSKAVCFLSAFAGAFFAAGCLGDPPRRAPFVWAPPASLLANRGQEHGRTIPSADDRLAADKREGDNRSADRLGLTEILGWLTASRQLGT